MAKDTKKVVELPQAARDHMSETAKAQLAEHAPHVITGPIIEPPPPENEGEYIANGPAGPGWYHYSTSINDVWAGHGGEADFYVFDFNVQSDGSLTPQGDDFTDTFDAGGLDMIFTVNTNGDLVPYVSIYDVQSTADPTYQIAVNPTQGQPDIVFMEVLTSSEIPLYEVVNSNAGSFDWDITI